jgi:hypothetical protein
MIVTFATLKNWKKKAQLSAAGWPSIAFMKHTHKTLSC